MAKKREMARAEKTVLKRYADLEYPTDRFGPSSLMTQASHVNSSRIVLESNQTVQFVSIDSPEMPLVPTGFENILGSYSSMSVVTEDKYEIVAKFEKNPFNYILIGYDKKKRRYHAWKRTEMEEHSEGFATRYNNNYIDSLEVGDVVPKGTRIQKSANFDKYGNYCHGKNVNVVYLASSKVHEDGIYAMNGVEKLFNTYRSYTETVILADGDILLNIYGEDDEYQPFPLVGQKAKWRLAVVRRSDNSSKEWALKEERLRDPDERKDKRKFRSGRVVDIEIYTNKEPDKIAKDEANMLVAQLYMEQQAYYKKVKDFMLEIVDTANADPKDCERLADDAGPDDHCYTVEFSRICDDVMKFTDSSVMFSDDDDPDSMYGTTKIVFRLLDEEEMVVGSKLAGRSGNKGVVAKIAPPDKWWHMEDGRPIHFVFSAIGVVPRLAHQPLYEHDANSISHVAVEAMKKTDDLGIKGRIVYDVLSYLNPDEAKSWKKWYAGLTHSDKAKTCRRIEREGITIVQDPIDNADIRDYARAHEQFPVDYQHIIFEDGMPSMRKVQCAKLFVMRLKQDPIEKFSARSRGPVNPLTMLPAKSNLRKQSLEPFSNSAVRFEELVPEMLMAMVNHPAAMAAFTAEYSTSYEAKLALSAYLYSGDYETEDPEMVDVTALGKKNVEWIQGTLGILGAEVHIVTKEAPPGEYFLD